MLKAKQADAVLTQVFEEDTARWFETTIGTPTRVQEESWPAIAAGGHVLVSAPTGTGKTLSAFLVFIDRLKRQAARGELRQELRLLYISPLKALGNDIRENLRRPLEGIAGPEITAAIRTGDTPQSERRRMLKNPPNILITTPESLYLLLSTRSGRVMLGTCEAIILDELHAMINTKRGAHLMLSLARLDRLCGRNLQRIGLSATIEPLQDAALYLASPDPYTVIAPKMEKAVEIEVNSPLDDMRTLPEGTIWPEIARSVYEHSQGARTVIAFVEGRAQAEKLAHGVNLLGGEGYARTHHGCVSKEQRLDAEQKLRSGELRVLCATSSMELGIDVGEVDLVLQVGFPRTISSTMQRLGRAGHNPGRTSVMHMFPRTAAEGVYCGLTAETAMAGGIERSHPPRACLDVVAQHLVSMASEDGYSISEAMQVLGRAYPFQQVTREEVEGVLRMLAGDYEHQLDHPARPRVLYDRIHGMVLGDAYSRMLALSAGGTIPDRGYYAVKLKDGTRLGELDEEFVFEARVGDKFLLGAFAWRIGEIRQDSVIVTPASTDGAQAPFWKGDSTGRTYETGLAFGRLMRELSDAYAGQCLYNALRNLRLDDAAAKNAEYFLTRQMKATGCLPDDRTLLIEHFPDTSGNHQMMVHSLFGGQVNAGLALLMKDAAYRLTGMDVICFDDDDGFLLYPYGGERELPDGLLYKINPGRARGLLGALLLDTPVFNIAFRYNAGRALMMGARMGTRLPLWIQRLRGAQALDNAVTHPDHPLLVETRRECLEDYWDLAAIEKVLADVHAGRIAVRELHVEAPSPMSLPHRRQAEGLLMYDYAPTTSGTHRAVAKALEAEEMMAPAPEQLERAALRVRAPQDANQLHALLMAEGDLIAGEVDVPIEWLEALSRDGRALYIEPGLWIAAEQSGQYRAAFYGADSIISRGADSEISRGANSEMLRGADSKISRHNDIPQETPATEAQAEEERLRVVRRCLRYRGGQDAASLSARYFLEEDACAALLEKLVQAKSAVMDGGIFYHAEVYGKAQRATVAMRRREIETLPPERFAALLASRTRVNAAPEEQLARGLDALMDQPFAPALVESVLLPARVLGYRPQMLDGLLAQGGVFFRLVPGDKPMLAFHRYEDIDWDQAPHYMGAALDAEEAAIADALARRGASFAQALAGLSGGRPVFDILLGLMEKGLVHADSFAPLRQWLAREKPRAGSDRARIRGRVMAQMAGRWELSRPLKEKSMEEKLALAFDRSVLLCRETAQGIGWPEALETLRHWEYTGRVRRGYFIRGLSGAQFIRGEDFRGTVLAMQSPREEVLWLNAADPAQAWGRALKHREEASFLCVPGNAVALSAGRPVALFERQGEALRVLDTETLPEALTAFVREYRLGRVFEDKKRITVKHYPEAAKPALEAAGFQRQMLDYEVWRKAL